MVFFFEILNYNPLFKATNTYFHPGILFMFVCCTQHTRTQGENKPGFMRLNVTNHAIVHRTYAILMLWWHSIVAIYVVHTVYIRNQFRLKAKKKCEEKRMQIFYVYNISLFYLKLETNKSLIGCKK